MAISLLSLSTTQSMRPPLLTVYGTAGVGKTTFGFSAPNPVGLLTEDGLGLIQATVFPLFRTFSDVLAGMDALINEAHDFETAVIDSLDWLEPLIWAEVCRQQGINSIEEVGYGKGYTFAIDLWRNEYIARLNRLRDERGMGVVQIAHALIKRFDSPETEPYDRYEIKLHAKAAALIQEHSDAVLFANYKVATTKSNVGFGKQVNRAVGTGQRVLYTQERPAFLAKNRYNLSPELPLEWNALQAQLGGQPIPDQT